MKTIFLASGRSSRMAPLSDKSLFNFCGTPLFIRLLKNAQSSGLENFIIITNQDNKSDIETGLKASNFSAKVTLQENLDEGMAGGINDGLKLVEDDEPVFILGGNDYVEPSAYKKIFQAAKNKDGAILAKKVETYFPGGYIEIDKNNRIQSIVEKPGEGNEPSDLVNIVAHFFQRAGQLKIALKDAASSKDDVYEIALQNLFKNHHFQAVSYDDHWQAIKYPWHVLEMMDVFLQKTKENKIHSTAEISKSAIIKGDFVTIESGVKIFENAVIQGPCYIGKNAVVGNNALVRNSHIGDHSAVGYNTEIARSYLADHVTTHIAYIGDSIVDSEVNFGAYSCTANLRLDKKTIRVKIKDQLIDSHKKKLGSIVGQGAQIGVHSSLMPGSKVDAHDLVKPHTSHL
jgi:bifunctional UDP-N-acetylglucosamine pyrophosphorylase/glucosamine-1-phosphate N-acetyltransferase